jgi:hypothetical protein
MWERDPHTSCPVAICDLNDRRSRQYVADVIDTSGKTYSRTNEHTADRLGFPTRTPLGLRNIVRYSGFGILIRQNLLDESRPRVLGISALCEAIVDFSSGVKQKEERTPVAISPTVSSIRPEWKPSDSIPTTEVHQGMACKELAP